MVVTIGAAIGKQVRSPGGCAAAGVGGETAGTVDSTRRIIVSTMMAKAISLRCHGQYQNRANNKSLHFLNLLFQLLIRQQKVVNYPAIILPMNQLLKYLATTNSYKKTMKIIKLKMGRGFPLSSFPFPFLSVSLDKSGIGNWNHLQMSWSFRPVSLLPGQESRLRRQKGPGETFPVLPFWVPQRDAGAKRYPG